MWIIGISFFKHDTVAQRKIYALNHFIQISLHFFLMKFDFNKNKMKAMHYWPILYYISNSIIEIAELLSLKIDKINQIWKPVIIKDTL